MTISGSNDSFRAAAEEMAFGTEIVESLRTGKKVEDVLKRVEEERKATGNDFLNIYDCVYTQISSLPFYEKNELVKRVNNLLIERLVPRTNTTFKSTIEQLKSTPGHLREIIIRCLLATEDSEEFMANAKALGLSQLDLNDRLEIFTRVLQGKSAFNDSRHFLFELGLHQAPIDMRIGLYKLIASQAEWARSGLSENFDKLGFVEDINGCAILEDKLSLCGKVAAQGEWAAAGLLININQLGFETTEQRFQFCRQMAYHAPATLVKLFNSLGLGETTEQQRLEICKVVISKGAAQSLVYNFKDIGLYDITHKLELCTLIALNNIHAASALADCFDTVGLSAATIEQRLGLCKTIAKQKCGRTLVRNFEKLELEHATLEQRLELCQLIASLETESGILAENFSKLGLAKATLQQRLDLCKTIASHGGMAAAAVATNFDKLSLNEATTDPAILDQRWQLCMLLAVKAPSSLVENLSKLSFISSIQQLELYIKIAGQGKWAIKKLIDWFAKLKLDDTTNDPAIIALRLKLCMQIASGGDEDDASFLVPKLVSMGLTESDADQRLQLCMQIASRGEKAAKALAEELRHLCLDNLSMDKRIELYKLIATKGETAAVMLSKWARYLALEKASIEQLIALLRVLLQNMPVKNASSFITSLQVDAKVKEQLVLEYSTLPGALNYFSSFGEIRPYINILFFNLPVADAPNLIEMEKEFEALEQALSENLARSPKLSFLMSTFNSIQKSKSFRTRVLLTQWLAYTAGVLRDLPDEQLKVMASSPLITDIQEFRNPESRYSLIRQLSYVLAQTLGKVLTSLTDYFCPNLALIPLSRLRAAGMPNEVVSQIVQLINDNKKTFWDTKQANELLKLLVQTSEFAPFKADEIDLLNKHLTQILGQKKHLSKKDQSKQMVREIMTLNAILGIFGRARFFECLASDQKYEDYFLDKFKELFPVSGIPNFQEQYHKTFGSFRNPMALYAYLRSVQRLPKYDQERVRALLNRYVTAVLTDTFPAVRYDTTHQPHLAHVFNQRPATREAWLHKAEARPLVRSTTAITVPNYKTILTQKIITDKHLDPNEYPVLRDFLGGDEKDIEQKLVDVDPKKASLQRLLIQICQNPEKLNESLSAIDALQLPLGEFANDLKAFRQQEKPKSVSGYQVMETDDACDLLLIGTEIDGSCQRVNGNPELNKCLVSYLMHGEIRVIAVKDANGALVARSVIRLLWDGKNNTPILMQERLYSNIRDPAITESINQWAVEKAKAMGLPLVGKEIDFSGYFYNGSVEFLGGPAPYTYSDASGGVLSGPFETKGSQILYDPKKNSTP